MWSYDSYIIDIICFCEVFAFAVIYFLFDGEACQKALVNSPHGVCVIASTALPVNILKTVLNMQLCVLLPFTSCSCWGN